MRIAIVGSLNTELILGPVDGIPEWGKLTYVREMERRQMGSAPSVAIPLRKLGQQVAVLGTVGEDAAGEEVIQNLNAHGVQTSGIRTIPGIATGMCVSVFGSRNVGFYVSWLGAVGALTAEMLTGELWPLLSQADMVLLTGLFVLPGLGGQGANECFAKLRQAGITTALDTGWDSQGWPSETVTAVRELLARTEVFLPNLLESRQIGSGETAEELARSIADMGPRVVAVKMGPDGAAALVDGRFCRDPGFPREVRDTTAAGEAFNAGFLCALSRGLAPDFALRFANATASLFLETRVYPELAQVESRTNGPRN